MASKTSYFYAKEYFYVSGVNVWKEYGWCVLITEGI